MVTPRRAARSRGFRRLLPVSPVFWVSALAVVSLPRCSRSHLASCALLAPPYRRRDLDGGRSSVPKP